MDFELTDEQRGLRDSTRGLIASKGPVSATRTLADSGIDFDAELWQKGADLGWPALAISEEDGGLDQNLVDLAIVVVEHGRAVLPSPLIPTAVVADAIARGEGDKFRDALPDLLDGSATAAWAFAERGRVFAAEGIQATAEKNADGFVLNGTKVNVQDAAAAKWLLVDALLDGEPARFIVAADTAGVTIRRQQTLDITRELDDVTFENAQVPESALFSTGAEALTGIRRSANVIAVLASAELVGVGEKLLELTVAYAKERHQFGRAIGSFQAVKHKCATMRLWVQASTAATYYAAMALGEEAQDADRAVSVAKSYASDAIAQVAGEALQVHGGIGFTWEHDLHLYIRRARTLGLLYGDVTHHRELLVQSIEKDGAGAKASA